MQRILVTGGAGYIGSHTAHVLMQRGYDVVVLDNLSRGHNHNVSADRLHRLSLSDTGAITSLLVGKQINAVIHFAAYIAVGESTQKPELYFANNTCGSVSLLTAMIEAGVKHLVFSSTAAVYGMPQAMPIQEDFPYAPVNPYGESKVMVEKILEWLDQYRGVRSIRLRYFNACGADPETALGEEHDPETHLIPLLLRAVVSRKPMTIFGDDYATPDGTCIRDYIHVRDLAEAHVLAVEHLLKGGSSNAFNVGTGTGKSVREVVQSVEEVTGQKVPYEIGPRREGDPPELVASSDKLRTTLGWSPRYTEIRDIIETAWAFEKKRLGL